MNNGIFATLQRIGRSFMLPIAILPIAGLLLAIGATFTNETNLSLYGLNELMGNGTIWYSFFTILKAAGDVVFANLPVLFALGVAIGMANTEKATAAIASLVGFLVLTATMSALLHIGWGAKLIDLGYTLEQFPELGGQLTQLANDPLAYSSALNGAIGTQQALGGQTTVLGMQTLNMGVFAGIIVGLLTAALHNKFYKIELPAAISFFGGTRFVPIVTAVTMIFIGILLYFVWPFVQNGISILAYGINSLGYFGTFLYGLIERSLIPFGLHHVFYTPFWQTSLGGTLEVGGKMIQGAQNIVFAQLADPNTAIIDPMYARFMAGKFPFMMFGLPAAALAMYHTAKTNKRKGIAGILFAAALTSFLTGITEPIEFTFLFVAPVLYAIHAVLAGLSFMLMHIFQVGVGQTFSGGFIDYVLFGLLQFSRSNPLPILFVGAVYSVIYYFVFKFIILKFNLQTPGREADDEESKLYTRADYNEKQAGGSRAEQIIAGLGGAANIVNVDACATRLRLSVHDEQLVDETALKATGAAGVLKTKGAVQVVYGPQVSVIQSEVSESLGRD
ncbi:PTS transporter subunit EIIC [Culicoidibacter larvae]|uniref:PTS glucose transporter subunit IIB n=1 Tax=Culicoidibacter larvae TaxID=2579976 RepID=A0A5R8QH02_9FIRM|nr:PTS transporter subunit EIIC [Culicoidibacter larvae]TLG77054.1 PTS glucose transporter subunit IIB [Culicoidibacter larvae]